MTGDIRAYFHIFLFSASSAGDGSFFGSSPNITANGNKWTVQLGGGFAKAMRGGGQPVKLATAGYHNTVGPKADSDPLLLQVTLTFSFPKYPRPVVWSRGASAAGSTIKFDIDREGSKRSLKLKLKGVLP